MNIKSICLLLGAAGLLGSAYAFAQNTLVALRSPISAPISATQSTQASPLQGDTIVVPGLDNASADGQVSTTANLSNNQSINQSIIQSEAGPPAAMSDDELAALRDVFLKAEDALDEGHEAKYFQLADKLKDYPLYPYLKYKWLRENLGEDNKVQAFLEQSPSSRYAHILKRKWLYHLASERQWSTFLKFYNDTSDTGLQCYFHRAQWSTGEKTAALEGAAVLWSVGHSQPKACDSLFKQLESSSLFNEDLFWQRFDAAMDENNPRLARYLKRYMSKTDAKTAELWLNLHRHPARYMSQLLQRKQIAQAPLMFAEAISRLARSDLDQAVELWDAHKQDFSMASSAVDKVEKRLAIKLALNDDASAYDRLGKLKDADYNTKTLRIRVALSAQDWPRVVTAIKALDATDQQSEKWQYWLARAYNQIGHAMVADDLFRGLAKKRDFYGYLAADRVNSKYQLVDKPVNVSAQQIDALRHRQTFQVVQEFLALDRQREAKLQWWHAVKQLDKSEIPVAAKLAQQWQWNEIPILTIARVEYWDDVDMRFPMSYMKTINALAQQYELDPMMLYGLIRRESLFNKNATSPVGARGLMQLMPHVARQIAGKFNERWRGSDSLYDPEKNLKYGSYYYHKLLTQFNGNYALALAAYNAGPNRVKQWLPDETLPVDIWIETIPYKETRNYVTSVLVYAMIYQQLTQQPNQLTLRDVMQKVQPQGAFVALN